MSGINRRLFWPDASYRVSEIVFACAFLLISVGGPIIYLSQPLHIDEAIYLVIGSKLASGGSLYTGVIDHKPPGVFYLVSAVSEVSGASYLEFRLLTYSVHAVAGGLVYWFGRQMRDHTTGMIASITFMLGVYLPHFDGFYFLTEPFVVLCTIIAGLAFITDRGAQSDLLVGLTLAVGVLFNQTTFLFGLAIIGFFLSRALIPVYRTKKQLASALYRVGCIGVGFGIPVGLTLLYFAANNQLSELLTYTMMVPLGQYHPPFDLRGHLWMLISYLPVWLLGTGVVILTGRRLIQTTVDEDTLFLCWWFVCLAYPGLTSFVGDHKMLFTFPPAALLMAIAVRELIRGETIAALAHELDIRLTNRWVGLGETLGLGMVITACLAVLFYLTRVTPYEWSTTGTLAGILTISLGIGGFYVVRSRLIVNRIADDTPKSPIRILLLCTLAILIASAGFNAVYGYHILTPNDIGEQIEDSKQLEQYAEGEVYILPFFYDAVYFSDDLEMANTYIGAVYSEPLAESVIDYLSRNPEVTVVVKNYQVSADGTIQPGGYFPETEAILVEYLNDRYHPVGTTDEYVIFERSETSTD